jgi:tetratricopeptide (TPR) repeat protein
MRRAAFALASLLLASGCAPGRYATDELHEHLDRHGMKYRHRHEQAPKDHVHDEDDPAAARRAAEDADLEADPNGASEPGREARRREEAIRRYNLGLYHLREGNAKEALRLFDGALRLAPSDRDVVFARARALLALDRPRDAVEGLDTIAFEGAEAVRHHAWRCCARSMVGRLNDAAEDLGAVVGAVRSRDPDERALALAFLEALAGRSGDADYVRWQGWSRNEGRRALERVGSTRRIPAFERPVPR